MSTEETEAVKSPVHSKTAYQAERTSVGRQSNGSAVRRSKRLRSSRSSMQEIVKTDSLLTEKEDCEVFHTEPNMSSIPAKISQKEKRKSSLLACQKPKVVEMEVDLTSVPANSYKEEKETPPSKEPTSATESMKALADQQGSPNTSDSNSSENTRSLRSNVRMESGLPSSSVSRKRKLPQSPEEWVDLLEKSPMVEMSRRKRKKVSPIDFDESVIPDSTKMSFSDEVWQTDRNTDQTCPESPSRMVSEVSSTTVQVGVVSSSEDAPQNDKPAGKEEYNVQYFRNLLSSETERLTGECCTWENINDTTTGLTEDVQGQIRTTVGQARLIMDQRFEQFTVLVDNCEFKRGEKETTCTDLKGFWDMIYLQVEDVDAKFADLKKLQENNWIEDKPKPVKKVTKKVSKPVVKKPVVKSKFAAFRAQMKKQQEEISRSPGIKILKEEEKVFEAPGFFTVTSPVRTPKLNREGIRRSATPSASQTTTDSSEKTVKRDVLALRDSGDLPPRRAPMLQSYVPLVPSPLMQDITPAPRPVRACTQKPPQYTPTSGRRRSMRRSVSLTETPVAAASSGDKISEEDFLKYLQPLQSRSVHGTPDEEKESSNIVSAAKHVNEETKSLLCPQGPSTPSGTHTSSESSEKPIKKDMTPSAGSGNILSARFSTLQSYVPLVPSPLMQDITPAPRPVRACTQKPRLSTPTRRRSTRRSVSVSDTPASTASQSKTITDDDFAKYLQPSVNSSLHATPSDMENECSNGMSSVDKQMNKDSNNSIVKQSSMIPGQNDTPADDIFNFDENEENVPPPFYISSRPSLLGTPPKLTSVRTRERSVPTGTLIAFTP